MLKKIVFFLFIGGLVVMLNGCGSNKGTENNSDSLPTVNGAFGKAPIVSFEGTSKTPPTSLVSNYLSEGKGKTVESGQKITVNYYGVVYGQDTPFDSSFSRGKSIDFGIGVGQVIKGWDQGLVGKKIGSRVLLIIPPELGYGSQASGPIPANSTLVFIVDIIDSK